MSVNRSFTSLFVIYMTFLSFSFISIISPGRTSVQCSLGTVRVATHALFQIPGGKDFHFSPLNIQLALGFWKVPFSRLRSFLLFLVSWEVCWVDVKFCQMLFLYQLRLSCRFFLYSINGTYYQYINWFFYVEPFLHSRNKSHLVMMYNLFNGLLNLIGSILSSIFASVFIRDTVCSFLYLQYLCWVLDFEVVLLS